MCRVYFTIIQWDLVKGVGRIQMKQDCTCVIAIKAGDRYMKVYYTLQNTYYILYFCISLKISTWKKKQKRECRYAHAYQAVIENG